jgi:hypothetical protein
LDYQGESTPSAFLQRTLCSFLSLIPAVSHEINPRIVEIAAQKTTNPLNSKLSKNKAPVYDSGNIRLFGHR